jgi:hypothetical protein
MIGKDVSSIGLVGARAYEMQAWQSPGANALEDAYWATSAPEARVPEVLALKEFALTERPSLKSRLMRFIEGISAAAVIVAPPK